MFMLNVPVLDLQFGSTNVSIMYFLQLCRPCKRARARCKKACHCLSITQHSSHGRRECGRL